MARNMEPDRRRFGNHFAVISNWKLLLSLALFVLQGVQPRSERTQGSAALLPSPFSFAPHSKPLPPTCLLREAKGARSGPC